MPYARTNISVLLPRQNQTSFNQSRGYYYQIWLFAPIMPHFIFVLLFYTIAAVFQLYLGGEMIYEMRRRKPKPTLLPSQVIFILSHHIGMAFDDVVIYIPS